MEAGTGQPRRGRAPRSDAGPMHASFSLGRWAGVEVGVNWSWIVIFGLIAWSLAAVVFPEATPDLSTGAYVAMAAVSSVLFFFLVTRMTGYANVKVTAIVAAVLFPLMYVFFTIGLGADLPSGILM